MFDVELDSVDPTLWLQTPDGLGRLLPILAKRTTCKMSTLNCNAGTNKLSLKKQAYADHVATITQNRYGQLVSEIVSCCIQGGPWAL